MIDYSGIGIVMGNANDELKKDRIVTDTQENDGLAKSIQKFALN